MQDYQDSGLMVLQRCMCEQYRRMSDVKIRSDFYQGQQASASVVEYALSTMHKEFGRTETRRF